MGPFFSPLERGMTPASSQVKKANAMVKLKKEVFAQNVLQKGAVNSGRISGSKEEGEGGTNLILTPSRRKGNLGRAGVCLFRGKGGVSQGGGILARSSPLFVPTGEEKKKRGGAGPNVERRRNAQKVGWVLCVGGTRLRENQKRGGIKRGGEGERTGGGKEENGVGGKVGKYKGKGEEEE